MRRQAEPKQSEKEFDPLQLITGILILLVLILIPLTIVDGMRQPKTQYLITVEGKGRYYVESYSIDNGFIKSNDWYSGFIVYEHHTDTIVLQGAIDITELGEEK